MPLSLYLANLEDYIERLKWNFWSVALRNLKIHHYTLYTQNLDSFILYNDQSLGEPASENRDIDNDTEPMDFNIIATLNSEEKDVENHGNSTKNETPSEPETETELEHY